MSVARADCEAAIVAAAAVPLSDPFGDVTIQSNAITLRIAPATTVPCAHPERRHECLFFICSNCGATAELEDPRVERLLAEDAAVLGYRVTRGMVEVEGMAEGPPTFLWSKLGG